MNLPMQSQPSTDLVCIWKVKSRLLFSSWKFFFTFLMSGTVKPLLAYLDLIYGLRVTLTLARLNQNIRSKSLYFFINQRNMIVVSLIRVQIKCSTQITPLLIKGKARKIIYEAVRTVQRAVWKLFGFLFLISCNQTFCFIYSFTQ